MGFSCAIRTCSRRWSRMILSPVVVALMLFGTMITLTADDVERRLLSPNAPAIVHLDFDRMSQSEVATTGYHHLMDQPVMQDLLAAIPQPLHFLGDCKIHDITIQMSDFREKPIVAAHLEIDIAQLIEVLETGAGYSVVEYEGIAIHHWLADPSAVKQAVGFDILSSERDGEVNDSQSSFVVFLDDRLVYSPYLLGITETIERWNGTRESMDQQAFDQWTTTPITDPVARVHVSYQSQPPVPGLSQFDACIAADDVLDVHARISFENAAQAGLIAMFVQPSSLAGQVNQAVELSKQAAEASQQVEAIVEEELVEDSEPSGIPNNNGQKNRLELGISFDGKSVENIGEDLEDFFGDVLSVELKGSEVHARWTSAARIETTMEVIGDGLDTKIFAKTYRSRDLMLRAAEDNADEDVIR